MAGNPTTFAKNSFSVNRQPIDFNNAEAPTVQMYHGGSIVVDGNVVGRITAWQPAGAYNREGAHIYELNQKTWGLPVDYVPGRVTGFNITWTRNEVWTQELELTLGYRAVWDNLTDQTFPFQARECLFRGATAYRIWLYRGCWFTEKNPAEWSAEGDGIMSVSCNMAYVSRKRVQ
jgi:hypothetical protein